MSCARLLRPEATCRVANAAINIDEYDQNRHYFLAHFFRDNYDRFASKLPYVSSGVSITRIEVWVTNKTGKYEQSRNFVGFMDLGEDSHLANDYWVPNPALPNPANASNNLLSVIKTDYPGARRPFRCDNHPEPAAAGTCVPQRNLRRLTTII